MHEFGGSRRQSDLVAGLDNLRLALWPWQQLLPIIRVRVRSIDGDIASWQAGEAGQGELLAAEHTPGQGGTLKLLLWQAPTILNSHLSFAAKDRDAARAVLEPLAALGPDGMPIAVCGQLEDRPTSGSRSTTRQTRGLAGSGNGGRTMPTSSRRSALASSC
ncbi:MAG: hypothetical protein LC797_10625 [Chloroflexi bacterium]|nr:hypothetical protein [Chloroflexota bacterium]